MPDRGWEHVPTVGDVAAMPLRGGGYGAFQVCGVHDQRSGGLSPHLVACALDWYSESAPALAELAAAGPLRDGFTDGLVHIGVTADDALPVDLVWLGTQPMRPGVSDRTNRFSGWEFLPGAVVRRRRWDRLPEAAKAAYRGARSDDRVELDLGAGPVTALRTVNELRCEPPGTRLDNDHPQRFAEVQVPEVGAVRWGGLTALPRLHRLRWSGPERGLAAALAAHPVIGELEWWNPPDTVDLATTNLTRLQLDGGASEARLPPGAVRLELGHDAPDRVVAPRDGRWITLVIRSPEPVIPGGLTGVRDLWLTVDGALSVVAIESLTDLERLHVSWTGPPGSLDDAELLARFTRLHTIDLTNVYGLDAVALPAAAQMPALHRFEVDGLRTTQAATLRANYRRTPVQLKVRGAKNDVWLAANLTNPFRDWIEDDRRAGATAAKAYTTALRAIERRDAGPAERTQVAQAALHTMVETLNTVDAKYHMIDTIRREEAGDAFIDLARRAAIPDDTAHHWFDTWCDF